MLPRAEIAKALSGAIQLAKFDKAGALSAFGHTGEAAKRSFFAAVIVATHVSALDCHPRDRYSHRCSAPI